jgi:hypothetical protein
MDCFSKTITLQGLDGKKAIFRGENVISSCVISAMTIREAVAKGEWGISRLCNKLKER